MTTQQGDVRYEVAQTDSGDYTILDTRTGAAMMAPMRNKRLAMEQAGALNRQGMMRHTRTLERTHAPRILNLDARRRFDASQRPADSAAVHNGDNGVDNAGRGVA